MPGSVAWQRLDPPRRVARMTADCYSYPIPAILITSGISLRVSTHLSFQRWSDCHFVPTGDSLGSRQPTRISPYTRRGDRDLCAHRCSSLITSKDTSPRVQRVPRIWYCAIARGENPSGLRRAPYLSDRVCAPPTIHRCNDPVRHLSLSPHVVLLRRNAPVTWIEKKFSICLLRGRGILLNVESDWWMGGWLRKGFVENSRVNLFVF